MNILHHKSWHVRNKNNIARVRRDEAKALEEEKEKERRAQAAEREARLNLLRQKANPTGVTNDGGAESLLKNLVSDDQGDNFKNTEHAEEVKKEREDYEKKIGLLTYLGQSEMEATDQPWYLKSHEKRLNLKDDNQPTNCDVKVKDFNDPLNDMKRYLDQMKASKAKSYPGTSNVKSPSGKRSFVTGTDLPKTKKAREEVQISHHRKHKEKSKHKHKRKHKHKDHKRRKSEGRNPEKGSESATIESERLDETSDDSKEEEDAEEIRKKQETLAALRAERLKREKAERERTKKLLFPSQTEEKPVDDRTRSFNSQFNPEFARQNRTS